MAPITVVIIDDDEYVRFGLREMIEGEEGLQVCGEARNLEEARAAFSEWHPDIALVDISMDGPTGGLTLIREMHESKSPTRSIVLSAHDESLYAARSLKEGAKGYVCKDKIVKCLVPAIHAVYSGKEFVSA